jgi:hypothetical protein
MLRFEVSGKRRRQTSSQHSSDDILTVTGGPQSYQQTDSFHTGVVMTKAVAQADPVSNDILEAMGTAQ